MKLSMFSGNGLSVALLQASTVMAPPADTNRTVQMANPILRNRSMKMSNCGGTVVMMSKSSPLSAILFHCASFLRSSLAFSARRFSSCCSSIVRSPYPFRRICFVRSSTGRLGSMVGFSADPPWTDVRKSVPCDDIADVGCCCCCIPEAGVVVVVAAGEAASDLVFCGAGASWLNPLEARRFFPFFFAYRAMDPAIGDDEVDTLPLNASEVVWKAEVMAEAISTMAAIPIMLVERSCEFMVNRVGWDDVNRRGFLSMMIEQLIVPPVFAMI
mmetsp:Transcript_6352/g.17280  ORF Transcript_6352/g.17280 Transcript_6352/m.17280 type:complete len:271 (+) Transcript_6352:517-1329(+)